MKRGEIWLLSLDTAIGAEIQKTRPCIIVSVDQLGKLPLKVIIPITDWKNHYEDVPWMVKLIPDNFNFLQKVSAADCFQVRSVSESRIIRKLGIINEDQLKEICIALALVFNIRY
ncbi:MAG: type II toxin-antitoxin system PemK/MazF family toxin [Saprospiraceae bacterium]|nr:type II toxin-antitoxin system PemK/MazF family toxin [Saprospiraceae bacterium]